MITILHLPSCPEWVDKTMQKCKVDKDDMLWQRMIKLATGLKLSAFEETNIDYLLVTNVNRMSQIPTKKIAVFEENV